MKKTYYYTPVGVCSQRFDITVEDGVIKEVIIYGGCRGNSQGIASLLAGMRIEDAISRLRGIDCNGKGTSCPDQISYALEQALKA